MDREVRLHRTKSWSSAATGPVGTRAPPLINERLVSLAQRKIVMEPVDEEKAKAPQTGAELKRKRFHIVKLEERIAPTKGGNTKNCYATVGCGPSSATGRGGSCY